MIGARRLCLLAACLLAARGWAVPESATASAEWPMVGHDERHTNNNPGMGADFSPPLYPRWAVIMREVGGPPPFPQGRPVIGDDKVFVPVSHGSLLFRFDAATGVREMIFHHSQNTWPGIHPAGGAVFFRKAGVGSVAWGVGDEGSQGVGLVAIAASFNDPFDAGQLLFDHAGSASPYHISQVSPCAPAVLDGEIVATDNDGRNFAVNVEGVVRWSRSPLGGPPTSAYTSPAAVSFATPQFPAAPALAFFRLEACDLYSGARRWLTGGARVPSADAAGRVFLPLPDQRLLVARTAQTGLPLWVQEAPGFGSSEMVALGDGKVVWNAGDHLHAFDGATGTTMWSTPVFMPGSSPSIGNGYVWAVGMGSVVALRLADGYLTWSQTGVASGSGISCALTPAGGGSLIFNSGPALISLGVHYLPQGVSTAPTVEPGDFSFSISWVPPTPLADRPAPLAYVLVRQCAQGTAPAGDAAVQYALFTLATNQVEVPLPPAGLVKPVPGAGQVVIRLPDHTASPECMEVTTIPVSDPAQFVDTAVNSGTDYTYRVFLMYEDGSLSPPSPPSSPTRVLHSLNGTPGALLAGGDWLEAEHDVAHTGWNAGEHLSYTPLPGFSSVENGFRPAWTFSGLEPGTTFTQPIASMGRVYVGGSDGRLYALNAQTGALLWWVSTGGAIRFAPAIQQYRQQVNQPFGTPEPIEMESLQVVSDSGQAFRIALGPSDAAPRSVERTSIGGTPISAPNSLNHFLYRNASGPIRSSMGDLPAGVGVNATEGFIGPDNLIVLTGPTGGVYLSGFGLVPLRGTGFVDVKSVRPSHAPYQEGEELLVAGYADGWYGLMSGGSFPAWIPIRESTFQTGQTPGPVGGGLIDPWGQDPTWWPTGTAPNVSESILEAANAGGPYAIARHRDGGAVDFLPGCTSGPGTAFFQPAIAPPPSDVSATVKDGLTGGAALAVSQASTPFTTALNGGTTALNGGTPVAMATTTQSDFLYTSLVGGCTGLAPAPTKLVVGTTDVLGRFEVGSEYLFTDEIFSRAFRFAGGPLVSGKTWTGVFAPRATGEFNLTGVLQRVNLVWTPTPWPEAVGYKLYREELTLSTSGQPEVLTPFHEIGSVAGRESRTFTDDSSGTQARLIRYMVRPYRNIRSGDGPEEHLGAPSLTVRPEAGIVDRIDNQFVPDVGFEEDTFLLTGRVTINQTLVGTSALKGFSITDIALTPSFGDLIVNRTVSASVPVGSMPTAEQVATAVVHPVPGIPVQLVFNTQGLGLVRTSLTDPGSTTFDQTLITDQEGKIQVLFQPLVGSTAQGPYLIKYFGKIGGNFTANGQELIFTNEFRDTGVIPHETGGPGGTAGYGYTSSWQMDMPAFIRQGFGTLTGPTMFGGVTPLSGQTTESAIASAVAQADFFGSPMLPCQGLACSVPVNTMTGAMMMEVPDLVLPSRGHPLGWGRTYTNFRVRFSPLGRGWHGNYDQRLERLADGSYRYFGWSGDIRLYKNAGGTFISPPGSFDTLTEQAGHVFLRSRAGDVLEFDETLALIRMANRRGLSQRLTYAGSRLTSIADEAGQSIALAYDGRGRVRQVSDSAGRVVRYEYNQADQLVKVTRPGGEVATYTYGSDGLLASWSEPRLHMGAKRGAVTYDASHRVSEVFDGEGQRKHTLGYELLPDGTSRSTISETCCGPRVDVYDRRGILTEQIDAKGQHTFMEFDAQLRLVSRTDRNGHATHITYNSMGLPATITDALNNQTKYEYEPAHGFLTAVTDALNRRTTFRYDSAGNCISATDAAGGVWTQGFDGQGQLRSRTDALGHTVSFGYNAVGDLTGVADALNRSTAMEFDARHREIRRTDAKGRDTDFSYDNRDLRTVVAYADGATTRTEHDAMRRTILVTDALNHTTQSVYDQDDRLVRMVDPRGAVTQYRYDVQGNLLGVTDANAHETLYDYNALNRLTKITDPLGKTQEYKYDPEGNRIERIDGNGVHTTFTFNELDQLVSRNLPEGKRERFAYDAAGQMTQAANGATDIRYVHDLLGLVTEHRYANLTKTFHHTYDFVGNRISLTYPDGQTMTFAYDAANEQVAATDSQAGTFRLEYDETGMRTTFSYPNGLATRSTYDSRDRLLSLVTTGEKGIGSGDQAPDFLYTYDASGNRVTMDRSDEGLTRYSYDAKEQLLKAEFPSEGEFQEFSYDPVGNRLTLAEGVGKVVQATTYAYNEGNELMSLTRDFKESTAQDLLVRPGVTPSPLASPLPSADLLAGPGALPQFITTTFAYDGNGSRSSRQTEGEAARTYTWDPQERLSAVSEGKSILQSNLYDSFVRRTFLTVNGKSMAVLVDATPYMNAALYEYAPGSKSATRRLWIADRLYGSVAGNQSEFFLCDALGSVTATSNASGGLPTRIHYKPFGEVATRRAEVPAANAIGFIGAFGIRTDESVSQDYMWNRFYEPSTGLFTSVDPLTRRRYAISRQDERYVYTQNNPLRRIDPEGLDLLGGCAAVVTCYVARSTTCEASFGSPCRAGCAGTNDPEDPTVMNKCLLKCSKGMTDCMKSYTSCVKSQF